MFCPRCGSNARSLLNLVACVSQSCRNYDPKWENEWNKRNKPRFSHNSRFGRGHSFLGNHTSKKGVTYDLYHCMSLAGDHLCLARFGDSDNDCWYVDSNESEVGIISSGETELTDAGIGIALKKALKVARGRNLIPRTP